MEPIVSKNVYFVRKGIFMKRIIFALFALVLTSVMVACGPSSLEIKEMSSDCEFNVEIRYVPNDSIAVDENSGNEIGFEKTAAIQMFQNFFDKSYPGSKTVYFESKNGELVNAKKLN